jgi:ubiquinone biosynthesis protein UbiJ
LLTESMIAGQPQQAIGASGNPEPITPEYVQSLREEIRRLEAQLARMQARLDQLEGNRP